MSIAQQEEKKKKKKTDDKSSGGGGGADALLALRWFTIFRIFQRMPIRDRPSWRGEHIGPMSEFGARCIAPENDFADRLGRANTIVVDDGDDQLHFLEGGKRDDRDDAVLPFSTDLNLFERYFE